MAIIPMPLGPAPSNFIGFSESLRRLRDRIQMVAHTDSTVLIHGEVGAVKERIARAIHEESPRKHGPFVKVNCAAMPGWVLENELFGCERGALAGTLTQTTGRFQFAHTGTLFLDEIGALPLELQPKLLRALKERVFERVGGSRTIRVDVRVVAATNRDLAQMVRERRFRADLLHWLNMSSISLPPRRDPSDATPFLSHAQSVA
jgi:transcriptional regulator with GAF, ATPase, and Fis domain